MSPATPTLENVPPEMDKQRSVRLTTQGDIDEPTQFKVWFAADGGKLYIMIRGDSLAFRQIRAHPVVQLYLGTGNRRVDGPEISALAHILPEDDWPWARHLLARKYWLLRIPFLWSRRNVFLEIEISTDEAMD
jgi:PPOX class probable F420-dependent enzyme